MLRPTYHIIVKALDDAKFQLALMTLGVTYGVRVTNNGMTIEDSFVQYMVELSKYELLYVNLASKIQHTINVDEWEANQAKASQGDVQPDNVEV